MTLKNDSGRFVGVSSIASEISSQPKVARERDIIDRFTGASADADLEVLRYNSDVASTDDGHVHNRAVFTH